VKTAVWMTTAIILTIGGVTHAASYTVLHSFAVADGTAPYGSPLIVNGTLYGTTEAGGSNNAGTLFALGLQTNSFNVLHTFSYSNTADGSNPYGGGLAALGATLYGVAEGGGTNNDGIVYQFDTGTKAFGIVHSFGAEGDGAFPVQTTLTQSDGILYGVTHSGGVNNRGIVYSINTTASNQYIVKHPFTTSEGSDPMGTPMIVGSTLYGTTNDGGTSNDGTVYKMDTASGAVITLHTFTGATSDGKFPWGSSVVSSGSSLYGMTIEGGTADKGVIYKMDTTGGNFQILHSFTAGVADGWQPFGDLLIDGSMAYGMTSGGGAGAEGIIFQLDLTTSQFTILHSFSGGDEGEPFGSLVKDGSSLYGFTRGEAATGGQGAIFKIDLAVPEPGAVCLMASGAILWTIRRQRRG